MRYRPISAALAVAAALLVAPSTSSPQETPAERVRRILSEVPLIDGHNDLPARIRGIKTSEGDVGLYDLRSRTEGDTDLLRLRQGMVGAQFWSVHVNFQHPRPAMQQLEQIDIAHRIIAAYPDELEFAGSASDIERVFASGKIASLLGIEGGHVIENSLGALRAFYQMGVRYMGLTHWGNTDWADSGTDDVVWNGLSPFGEEVVREMNRLGMIVDLSHVSPATMSDALNVTEAPVIFSHAAARALADHLRNVPDSILVRLRENGGVLMQIFYPGHLDLSGEATISDVVDHIEHIRDVAGIDHVGIGSDFDGIGSYVDGLEDVSTYPALFIQLVRRGWSDDDLRKLAGENLLRVMRQVESVARRLQRERPPSTRTIDSEESRPVERIEVEVAEDILETYAGEYALSSAVSVVVTLEGGALFVQATGEEKYPVFAESDTTFFLRVFDAQISFTKDDSGEVTGIILHQNGRNQPGRKVR